MGDLTFPIAGRASETGVIVTRPITHKINTNKGRNSSGGGGTDPNFSNVKLLLSGETANGSTPVDTSSSARTMTPLVGATVSTAQAKFGNGSVYIPSGATLQAASSADFVESGDLTLEFWARPTSVAGTQAAGCYANGSAQNNNYAWQALLTGGNWTFTIVFNLSTLATATGPAAIAGAWQHVAAVRSSGQIKVYVNGVGGTAVALTGMNSPAGAVFQLGRAQGFYNFDGYFDEYRWTPGVARYTANFTPPTAAFPTS